MKSNTTLGVGEELPYEDDAFNAVICVEVLEHVGDFCKVLAEVVRVLKPGGLYFFDTINRNRLSRFVTITIAEDILSPLLKGTHDPELFIRRAELSTALVNVGLVSGPMMGLGPWSINSKGDFTFGPLPIRTVIYMGIARKTEGSLFLNSPFLSLHSCSAVRSFIRSAS